MTAQETTPANRVDASFVPRPIDSVVAIPIGADTVLLNGWVSATVLNPSGALIWGAFDGLATLGEIADFVCDVTEAERSLGEAMVLSLTQRVGALGLLEGVGPPDDIEITVSVEALPRFNEVGAALPKFNAVQLDGGVRSSTSLAGTEVLLVNWNPDCGYCGSITRALAACEPGLAAAGVQLVLLAAGSAQANQAIVDEAGLDATVLRLPGGEPGPFPGVGTPAAFHLDAELRLMRPPAYGNLDVPDLVARLAGVDLGQLDDTMTSSSQDATRYLLDTGGSCPQPVGAASLRWSGTRVYGLAGFHVGVRYDNDTGAAVLDALFRGATVDDPKAGHSFSVALPRQDRVAGTGSTRGLNLLACGDGLIVRSRSVSRVLRALLWHLQDGMVGFDPASGRLRVRATAARIGSQMVLLQPGLFVLEERLQPLLARRGIALADVPFPELDPRSLEVVIPDLAIPHDRTVIESHDTFVGTQAELAPVLPGRYPLIGWGVTYPGDPPGTRFSPAEAAAATLSFVENTDDARTRLRELGTLFQRVAAFGLWYHSEADYVDALCEALGID